MPIDVVDFATSIVGVVIDNRSKRNALDEGMYRQLAELWPALAEDSKVRAVVVTGAPGAFCSGADLSAGLIGLPDIDDLIDKALLKTMFFPKPIVAAIDGACVAGGFELMLGCDIRLCSPGARFGLPEARWGIMPSGGGAIKLMSEIGFPRASELLLTGRLFDADEALSLGLVSAVIAPDALIGKAVEAAQLITDNSPTVTYAIKRYLHASRAINADLKELEHGLTLMARRMDAAEGMAAFREKRAPSYDESAFLSSVALLP